MAAVATVGQVSTRGRAFARTNWFSPLSWLTPRDETNRPGSAICLDGPLGADTRGLTREAPRDEATPGALDWKRRDRHLDADYQLVERCLRGEEGAWEDLVRTYSRRI